VIGGGHANLIQGPYSVIPGGESNSIYDTAADHNVIGGGYKNVEQNPSFGTIAGGWQNLLDTAAWGSTVAGGDSNLVQSALCFIGGGLGNIIFEHHWAYGGVIAGGQLNNMHDGVSSFIGSGYANYTIGNYTTLTGGYKDTLEAVGGFIGGGLYNNLYWGSDSSVLVGGSRNQISGKLSFLGGGLKDTLLSTNGVLGGGQNNKIDVNSNFSVLVGGDSNNISDKGSSFAGSVNFIGGGQDNTIDGNGFNAPNDPPVGSAIVAGQGNKVHEAASFIGAGTNNEVKDDNSFVGAGIGNTITEGTTNAIVAGQGNSISQSGVLGHGSGFIGAGDNNSINFHARNAAIPAGDNLTADSYCQTVLGFFNVVAGSATDTSNVAATAEDPLLIIGNGRNIGGSTVRSDAFDVSYDGHTIVHDQLGDVPVLRPGAVFGGTYNDNIIYAWGDVPQGPAFGPGVKFNPTANFGVDVDPTGPEISHTVVGTYVIHLNYLSHTFNEASITATARDTSSSVGTNAGCIVVTCSEIGIPGPNKFIVRTYKDCVLTDEPFFFKFCGR